MGLPEPVPGLVIRYAYLWQNEYERGQEEGLKDRPCAIIMSALSIDGNTIVTVLPITHTPPSDPDLAIEIPIKVKQRLGLDDDRSWIILNEANRFLWPGPDLRPLRKGEIGSVAYGLLPFALHEMVKERFIALFKSRRNKTVPRTE